MKYRLTTSHLSFPEVKRKVLVRGHYEKYA
nr:MAG TPA: hypothetical protein [Bacteriophage sp.]